MADEVGADLVVLDPALPLGLVGPSLELPYDVVLHGAEVTVPGRLPGSKQALAHVLRRARHIVAAGGYPAAEAERAAGRPCRSRWCRRASTPSASARSQPPSATTPAIISPSRAMRNWWWASAAWCRARASTPPSARRRC